MRGDGLSPEAEKLVTMVGPEIEHDAGLQSLLNHLEPIGKDLAAEAVGGVRLMNMAKSKGLTVDTTIVMGVEEGLVPLGDRDRGEERRLLYVAMTRAQKVCVMTCASRRTGQLARSGGGRTQVQRRRSPLLDGLSYGRPIDAADFMNHVERLAEI